MQRPGGSSRRSGLLRAAPCRSAPLRDRAPFSLAWCHEYVHWQLNFYALITCCDVQPLVAGLSKAVLLHILGSSDTRTDGYSIYQLVAELALLHGDQKTGQLRVCTAFSPLLRLGQLSPLVLRLLGGGAIQHHLGTERLPVRTAVHAA